MPVTKERHISSCDGKVFIVFLHEYAEGEWEAEVHCESHEWVETDYFSGVSADDARQQALIYINDFHFPDEVPAAMYSYKSIMESLEVVLYRMVGDDNAEQAAEKAEKIVEQVEARIEKAMQWGLKQYLKELNKLSPEGFEYREEGNFYGYHEKESLTDAG